MRVVVNSLEFRSRLRWRRVHHALRRVIASGGGIHLDKSRKLRNRLIINQTHGSLLVPVDIVKRLEGRGRMGPLAREQLAYSIIRPSALEESFDYAGDFYDPKRVGSKR